uniref:hypothetical protein n=1 Tax=Alteromonas stellipolaris TaxID=233316 RepID=UPI0030FA2DE5
RIENPRVPGSIPGRGTIIRRALNRNVRGFFDLGYCIKLAEHAGVSLRLHRALQSRVEAPLFRKPLQKCEGFFDLGGLKT